MIIGSSNPIPGMTRTDGEAPGGHLLPRGLHAYRIMKNAQAIERKNIKIII